MSDSVEQPRPQATTGETNQHPAPHRVDSRKDLVMDTLSNRNQDETFDCNICMELAREPVVTLCGHLYCWGCLYKWTLVTATAKSCPVCKAGVDVTKVVPIYGRGCDCDPRSEALAKPVVVPPRPAGQRQALQYPQQPPPGILQSLFGLNIAGPGGAYVEALTPEQQHQAFLSRLLLMLGSFVIMCLLLF